MQVPPIRTALLLASLLFPTLAAAQPTPPASTQPAPAAAATPAAGQATAAAQPAAEALLRQIEQRYSKAEALRAQFEITTVNQALGEEETERGTLFVSRPDRMKWQYSDPEGKLVLLDGHFQWMYLPEEAQVFRGEQTEMSSELQLTLLADPGTLEKRFELSATGTSAGPLPAGLVPLYLTPRQHEQGVTGVVLGVEPATGKVLAMHITDEFDNRTRIHFADLELNPRLSPKLFEFKRPKGTELLNFEGEPLED